MAIIMLAVVPVSPPLVPMVMIAASFAALITFPLIAAPIAVYAILVVTLAIIPVFIIVIAVIRHSISGLLISGPRCPISTA